MKGAIDFCFAVLYIWRHYIWRRRCLIVKLKEAVRKCLFWHSWKNGLAMAMRSPN